MASHTDTNLTVDLSTVEDIPGLETLLQELKDKKDELNRELRELTNAGQKDTQDYKDKFKQYNTCKADIARVEFRIRHLNGTAVDSTSLIASLDNMANDKNPGGADLHAIPPFTGDGKIDAEQWLWGVEVAAKAFQWKETSYQKMAAMKLQGDAAVWLDAETKMRQFPAIADEISGIQYTEWEMFKMKFLLRWKPQQEPLQATEAVMNLKQANGESVLGFLDRVVLAIDKKNWQAKDKSSKDYRAMRDADLFSFGAAGMKNEVRKVVLSNPTPPTNFVELKEAAVNAETALKAQHHINEMEAREEANNDNSEIAALRKEIEALKATPKNLSTIRCYKCGQLGHIRKNCRVQPGQQRPGGRGGGGGRGRGRGRGRGQGQRGGWRSGPPPGNQGNWGGNQGTWQPQANFGQPGNYYQREVTQMPAQGRFVYQMGPPPTPHMYPETRVNTLVEDPWMISNSQGNY